MDRVLEPEVMDTVEEAESYDAMDHREPNEAFVGRLLEIGAHGRILDVGTGPGHLPLMLCARLADARVVGVDLSREMLKIAEWRRAADPNGARVEYRLADAKVLEFADGAFDVVCSNTILHHIPDPVPFLREVGRVAGAGGTILVRDLYRPPDRARLQELVAMHAAAATPYQRKLFGDSLNAAFTPDELRALAREAGLEAVEVVVDTDRHMSLQRRARS
ncbi:MAG TPA: methyltransferase domain-containing protein [Planctomycetota bacterium]